MPPSFILFSVLTARLRIAKHTYTVTQIISEIGYILRCSSHRDLPSSQLTKNKVNMMQTNLLRNTGVGVSQCSETSNHSFRRSTLTEFCSVLVISSRQITNGGASLH